MANRNTLPTRIFLALLVCFALSACFESKEEVESDFSGSVGDGPITGALIDVWTADGKHVTSQRSSTTANYKIKLKAKRGDYPLILTAKGGTDLVTNAAPDFELVSTLTKPGKNKTVNLNPFSTLAVQTAQAMPGGLTEDNVATAHNIVMDELSFGLDSSLISNAISGQVDNNNVASVVKASEAVGEMLRRTSTALTSGRTAYPIADIIDSLSGDLVDGVFDGLGAGSADPRVAALSRVVSAQVLLETMTNSLHVNGVVAVDAMDAAILVVTDGTGTQSTRDVTVTASMLTELKMALRAAAVLGYPDELAEAIGVLQSIQAGATSAQVQALLPVGLSAVLDSLVITAAAATDAQIDEINSIARADTPPPIDGPTEHEVTITVQPGGTVMIDAAGAECTSTCTFTIANGELLTLSAQPDSGFTFAGWGGACSGTAGCALTVTSNRSVTAEFAADAPPVPTHFLSLTVTGSGTVVVGPDETLCDGNCIIEYDEGQVVTLSSNASEGFVFDAWSGDCAGTETCSLTMSADKTVQAVFSQIPPPPPATYTITMSVLGQGSISLSPTGTVCDATCSVSVEDGTVVTAVAEPTPGHVFEAWSGDCNGSGSCQLTVNSDKALVAAFADEPPPATNEPPVAVVTANPFVTTGSVVSVSGTGSFDSDGDPLTYDWVLTSKPSNSAALLSSPDAASTQFHADVVGTFTVQLIVHDGQDASAPDVVTITASAPTTGSLITELVISNTSSNGTNQLGVPVTFGHPFQPGEVPAGTTLSAATLSGETLPLQTDMKSFHDDGSLRHAVVTAMVNDLPSSGSLAVKLLSSQDSTLEGSLALSDLPPSFDAVIKANIGGEQYSASARNLLESTSPKLWLDGPLVAEWQVAGPLMNGSQAHPHLQARFYVRAYAGMDNIRVSVILENNWTWQPNPSNFVYDLSIEMDGSEVFSQSSVNHYGHARWRKVFWSGVEPDVHIAHDTDYLIATKAVPNYDRTVTPSQSAINANYASVQNSGGLMGRGLYRSYFPGTGAHPQIGPLPAWSALYILTQDAIAKKTEIWNSEQAGSFSVHLRDKNTDLPVTLVDYPDITTHSNFRGRSNYPPQNDNSPYTDDTAHQSSMGYLSYLITGDYYFLEELQFWANQNSFGTAPTYRGYGKGLYIWQQVRGEGWSMRTLSQTAYITPDTHPLKGYFTTLLENNISEYIAYLVEADTSSSAPGNRSHKWWMDDFFTYSIGQTVEMGFTSATPVLEHMAQGPIGRMTAPGFCWIKAVPYEASGGYPTWAEVFAANWPHLVGLECNSPEFAAANGSSVGDMGGYAYSATGFGANMQPALAVSVDSGITNAATAWQNYAQRNPKQNYSEQPQFAIIPRMTN